MKTIYQMLADFSVSIFKLSYPTTVEIEKPNDVETK